MGAFTQVPIRPSNDDYYFLAAFMLGPHPYLWPNIAMGNSPPIATRSGWLSIAIIPFMMYVILPTGVINTYTDISFISAFSTKVNWVAAVTGTSHEKLQVFHRWSTVMMCESQ